LPARATTRSQSTKRRLRSGSAASAPKQRSCCAGASGQATCGANSARARKAAERARSIDGGAQLWRAELADRVRACCLRAAMQSQQRARCCELWQRPGRLRTLPEWTAWSAKCCTRCYCSCAGAAPLSRSSCCASSAAVSTGATRSSTRALGQDAASAVNGQSKLRQPSTKKPPVLVCANGTWCCARSVCADSAQPRAAATRSAASARTFVSAAATAARRLAASASSYGAAAPPASPSARKCSRRKSGTSHADAGHSTAQAPRQPRTATPLRSTA
jgi:hypothetical protein